MPAAPPTCPDCAQTMKAGGLVLSGREDDGARTCQALWRCPDRHVWWRWADREDDPLEVCPYPNSSGPDIYG
ncbi:Putative dehydrogenase [Streptomyces clavuligerus]|uniref:Putative dehydrogenase n=1 Tax=Streptomyces clavuligerus TaxID=1901 RepID=E2Q237_STRCL|nr:Putative dehydrogenase [Streptomyces clavuligerus]